MADKDDTPMLPAELLEIQDVLHWSTRDLAAEALTHHNTVVRWRAGTARIPDDMAAWLRKLAGFHRANPSPRLPVLVEPRPARRHRARNVARAKFDDDMTCQAAD